MSSSTTATSILRPQHSGFRWFVLVSVLLHVVAVVIYALGQGHNRPTIDLTERAIQTSLVKLGKKKRAPKLLPRKHKAPAPRADEKLLATKQTPPDPTPPPRDKINEALKKIEDEAARKARREAALARIAEQVGDDEPEEGDPEGSVDGTASQAARMSLTQAYFARVHDRIKAFYTVPSIISESERRYLQAIIVVLIAPDGRVLGQSFEKRSGNDAFDRALEAAVQRASPFPTPPAFLRDTVRQGVGIRFRP